MLIPVFYRIRTVDRDDDDEVNAELESHSFTLYYNATEDFQNGAMTLHLRHYIADLQADDEFMSDPTMGIEHFDISAPLQAGRHLTSTRFTAEPNMRYMRLPKACAGRFPAAMCG